MTIQTQPAAARSATNRARVFPPAVYAIGRNYADHAAEMKKDVSDQLIIFMKNPACVIGNGEPIIIPGICDRPSQQVDYEGELAVIIGTTCRDVAEKNAFDVISGYAVANDVSARWWQQKGSGGQYVRGKSFDTFCPMTDPVPPSQVGNPQSLRITTKVNGETLQDSNTNNMLFSIAKIISELTTGTTLLAGTVILTGTPAGVGAARNPPRFLAPGDVVEVTVEKVGTLRNPVVHE
ncbi:MAG TPA: fumarylacetoacetate hydrolase family protein [Phycisphaerales bacterium]|nr:fumarylacetoacetate hydrolase family protein [Phycisphaerales bacterium]